MAFSLLPAELKLMIFKYLNTEAEKEENFKLTPYATVNREWQAIFEEEIFEDIQITTRKRLAGFNNRLWVRTRRLIRSIALTVELESYYDHGDARCRYENEDEQRRNNEIFTASIQSLFNTLAKWPRRGGEVFSVSRSGGCVRESLTIFWIRDLRSWLQFDEKLVGVGCASVPLITCLVVTGGQIRRDDLRKIEPVSCSLIMTKLPRLDHLTLYLDDRCTWDPELRYRHRKGMLHKVRT